MFPPTLRRLAMKEPCAFYKIKVTTLQRKTISPNRNSEHPHIYRIGYCAHPKSKYPRNTIHSGVPCGGDLEKCVISPEDRQAA